MEKYKERAKELVKNIMFVNHFSKEEEDELLQAMYQFAEEVKKDIISKMFSSNPKDQVIYTKEQVEELLQEQKIAIKNEKDREFIELRNNKQIFTRKDMGELLGKQRELSSQQTLTNREDILNAKLKI